MLFDNISKLEKLNAKKSKFIVLVKWRYPFYTHLENLEKPDECALIGIFAEQIRHKLFDGYDRHFDSIFWFQADYSDVDQAYSDSGSIEVPEISEIMAQITKIVSPDKIRLLECEEVMIDVLCKVRYEYLIPGAKPNELDVLRNKALLKEACKERDIPTAPFAVVDFQQNKPCDELIQELESEIQSYPMFKKPIKGFGSGGGDEIYDRKELRNWIESMQGKSVIYLVEKCIHKREFWANVILLQDGTWIPHYVITCGNLTIKEAFDRNYPIPFIGKRFEDCENEFPRLSEFVGDVIRKLNVPVPHVFSVQGFQLEPGTNKYFFTECGYRLNGARGCGLSYKVSGISQETAFLSTYMNPNYAPKQDNTPVCYSVWYQYRPGTLKSHSELPDDSPVKSNVKFDWLVPIGSELFKASSFNHFIVKVEIEHTNESLVKQDLGYFMDIWRPDID